MRAWLLWIAAAVCGATTWTVDVGPAASPFAFVPATLTVNLGDVVQFAFRSAVHTVDSLVSGTDPAACMFDAETQGFHAFPPGVLSTVLVCLLMQRQAHRL
jgi:plastocyanin